TDESANATAAAVAEVTTAEVAGPSVAEDETAAPEVSSPQVAPLEVATQQPTIPDEPQVQAPARPRRKRGRVVAPAGPPVAGNGDEA
ncbi:MAG: hypothetical protein WA994_02315, partial [Ornithinimicrobium sp.]